MSTTNIIGRKITGFRFENNNTDLCFWNPFMTPYIGKIGEIIALRIYPLSNVATVKFEDNQTWEFPLSLIEQHLVPESGGEKDKGPWKVIERSGQIADTGDYVGEAELTDGKIHLYCTTEFDCEADEETPLHTVANILNESKADLWIDFMRDDPDAMDLLQKSVNAEAYRVENERLRAVLQVIVSEAEKNDEASRRAADIHNNTDGVGQRFDYMSAPPMPVWYKDAKSALSQNT